MEEVLTDVRRFMTEGHRELVILKFSHYEGFDGEAFDRLVKQINASLGPWLFKSLPRGKMLADTSLAEYVGKTGTVLVVCDELYPLDRRSKGIWVYRDWDSASRRWRPAGFRPIRQHGCLCGDEGRPIRQIRSLRRSVQASP